MGIVLNILGTGFAFLVAGGLIKDMKEENKRKESICNFDNGISRDEFYNIVKLVGKSIQRVTNLYADGPIVYGMVRSQSGISDWKFKVDFNDYGKITGKYWLTTDNSDSKIPKVVADRIAQQIDYIKANKKDK